jgi:hypothetical protein
MLAKAKLGQLRPIPTFKSLIDFTVSTRAIVPALYAHLPANGGELALFDVDRSGSARDVIASPSLPMPMTKVTR